MNKTIKELLIYENTLVEFLEQDKEDLFYENILQNGRLMGRNELTKFTPPISEENLEELKKIRVRFNAACKNIRIKENIPLMKFILHHFPFDKDTLQNIVSNSLQDNSANWIEKICIPIYKNPANHIYIDMKAVFSRKDVDILNVLTKHQVRSVDHVRIYNASNIEELEFIFNVTYKSGKIRNFTDTLKNEYKILFDNFVQNLPRKEGFFWESYQYFKNIEQLRTGNYFNPEYVILKLLCNHHSQFSSKEHYMLEIMSYLHSEDKDFSKNLKYIVKSYPFVKEIKKKLDFKDKLENEMPSSDDKTIKKYKL